MSPGHDHGSYERYLNHALPVAFKPRTILSHSATVLLPASQLSDMAGTLTG